MVSKKLKKILTSEPDLSLIEKKKLNKCFDAKTISTYGQYSNKLEKIIAKKYNTKYITVTNSGSSALILAYKAINIKKNDIVICPSYTFIASINSILHNGGIPWLFDIDDKSYCLNLDQVERKLKKNTFKKGNFFFHKKNKRRIIAINPVYFCGAIPDYKRIKKIADKYNLKIISDCAGATLSTYVNKNCLKYSDIFIFSFNGNKPLTFGGGGCLGTNKKKYYKLFSKLSMNAITNKKYYHSDFGFNYRLTNLHASIGIAQFSRIEEIIKKKIRITKTYKDNINSLDISMVPNTLESSLPFWINLILIKNIKRVKKIKNLLNKNNIECSNFWIPMHKQKKKLPLVESMSLTNKIYNKILPLPSSTFLNNSDIKNISSIINNA